MSDEKHWFVVQTKPRSEKKVCTQIQKKNIEVFLPIIPTVRIWSDRKKVISVPLFPGYLFVFADKAERLRAISNTTGALRYLFFQKRPAIISETDIENIKVSLSAPKKIRIEKNVLAKGDLVEVTDGVFRGLKGVVTEFRGNYRLIINIAELQATFSVELSNADIKTINKI